MTFASRLGAPVEIVPPIIHELSHVGHAEAVLPAAVAELGDPACAIQSHLKIVKRGLRNLHLEWLTRFDSAIGAAQTSSPVGGMLPVSGK
jgi:hypothetical protein